MNAEITWDLVMSGDMEVAEGCYRLEDGPWQVVTAWKSNERWEPCVRNDVSWESGVRGMNIVLHRDEALNKETLLQIMSSTLGVEQWTEVRGPDSIQLR
jgi:hypothetical protein